MISFIFMILKFCGVCKCWIMLSIKMEMHISAYFHCNGAFGGIFDGIFFQLDCTIT